MIFLRFFTIIFLTLSTESFAQVEPDFMSDLNSELEAQKDSLDPFQGEEVEIDLDSLNVEDPKSNISENNQDLEEDLFNDDQNLYQENDLTESFENEDSEKKSDDLKEQNSQPITNLDKTDEKNQDIQSSEIKKDDKISGQINSNITKNDEAIPTQTKAIKNLMNKLSDNEEKSEKSVDQETEKNDDKLNDEVKANDQQKKDDEVNPDKISNKPSPQDQEYEELRKKYIEYIKDGNIETPFEMPAKKDINRYIIDETPALPILSRYRTNENLHIPVIPTPYERIDSLFQAIAIRNVSFFNSSYKYVQNPNVFNRQGDNLITYSIIFKSYPTLISALNKGADPNLPNKLGYTPAAIAIELKDLRALEMLFENGADINYEDKFGRNYLMYAARVGFLGAIDFLIKKGIDINATDNDGFTALAIAYKNNREVAIKYLIKNGGKTWAGNPFESKSGSLMKELENRWK